MNGIAPGSATITANATLWTSGTLPVTVLHLGSLSFNTGTIAPGVGKSVPVTVTNTDAAPAGGMVVTLTVADTSIASAPQSVTIPQGATSVAFSVTGVAVGSTGISATAQGSNPSSANITVRQNAIVLPASVLVAAGQSVTFDLSISDPAPAGGLTVSLATTNPSIGTVTSSVVIPQGSTSATATANGVSNGTTSLSASAPNYNASSTVLTVKTITMSFNPLSVSVPATQSTGVQVTLSDAAPTGGLTVSLAISNTTYASVSPSSVTVPAGQLQSPYFTVAGTTQGNTTLTATAPGVQAPATAPVYVGAAPAISYLAGGAVSAGMHRGGFGLNLNSPAPAGGLTITLTSSDPSKATVPATVTIPAGYTYLPIGFTVTGLAATDATSGPVTLTAHAAGWTDRTSSITIATGTLIVNGSSNSRTTSSGTDNVYIYVNTPNCGVCDYFNADTAVTYTVNSTTAGIVTISPNPATAAMNQYYGAQATVGTPTAAGSYTISASASGFTSGTTGTTTVTQPSISYLASGTVSAGMHRSFGLNLDSPAPTGGLTITLTRSDPSKATIPTTVTIPAGYTYLPNGFTVTGLAATDATSGPVTLTAHAAGWTDRTSSITIATGTLIVNGSSNSRTTSSGTDNVYIYVNTPNCGVCDYFNADTAVTYTVNSTTAGIVTISPNPATAAMNQYYGAQATVGTPTAAGSYTISASASGFTSGTTGTTTVTQPSISYLASGTVSVGMHRSFGLNLDSPAPTGGLTVNLASTDARIATVPTTVTIPAGYTYLPNGFTVTGLSTGGMTSQTVQISASAPGWSGRQSTVTVATGTLIVSGSSGTRTTASGADNIYIYVNTPNCGVCDYFNADTQITYTINSSTSGIVTISPNPATASANQYYGAQATSSTPTATGSYTISASATGFITGTSGSTTVTPPSIHYLSSGTVSAGMHRGGFSINLDSPAPAGGLTITLTSSDTAKVTVPATVTIPAGYSYLPGGFTVTGLAPTDATSGPVTLTAHAAGWTDRTSSISIATGTLVVTGSSGTRTTSSNADTMYIHVNTPKCGECDYFNADTAVTYTVNSSTAGIVTISPNPATASANQYSGAQATVSTPTTTGSYTISASATGFTTGTTGTTTVGTTGTTAGA